MAGHDEWQTLAMDYGQWSMLNVGGGMQWFLICFVILFFMVGLACFWLNCGKVR